MKCVVALAVVLGCVTPGTRPHDMSTSAHESQAAEHERLAALDRAGYHPEASSRERHCGVIRAFGIPICWTSVENPTDDHRRDMEKHLKIAAEHRAASQALRDAESAACEGIAEEDRAMSPFEHDGDVVAVEQIIIGAREHRWLGAAITLRPVPGLTAPRLRKLIGCHLARNAALGHDAPEMPTCPLVPPDVEASVSETSAGFKVEVTSWNDAAAHEIWRRASSLKKP